MKRKKFELTAADATDILEVVTFVAVSGGTPKDLAAIVVAFVAARALTRLVD